MAANKFFHGKGSARQFRSQKPVEDRTADGVVFHSRDEMLAYCDIKLLVGSQWLTLQPKFELLPKVTVTSRGQTKKQLPTTWSADFLIGPPRASVTDPLDNRHLLIDIKGMTTPAFVLKLKLFQYCYRYLPVVVPYSSKNKKLALLALVRSHVETHGYGKG